MFGLGISWGYLIQVQGRTESEALSLVLGFSKKHVRELLLTSISFTLLYPTKLSLNTYLEVSIYAQFFSETSYCLAAFIIV